jgi:CRISPR-associated protein Cas2
MWLFVFFDLPTNTKKERKDASDFRKNLLQDGFAMEQYSIYTRPCASKEIAETHIKRMELAVPPKGKVSMLLVTEKQVGNMINIWGNKPKAPKEKYRQLTLF